LYSLISNFLPPALRPPKQGEGGSCFPPD